MNSVEDMFKFRNFCEKLEETIALLLQKGEMITNPVLIFDRKIAVIILQYNVGFGGYVPEYKILILMKKGVTFNSIPIKSVREISESNSSYFQIVRTELQTEKINKSDLHPSLGLIKERVIELFSRKNDNNPAKRWEKLEANATTVYKLREYKEKPNGETW